MRRAAVALLISMLLVPIAAAPASAGVPEAMLLIDYGNGDTEWIARQGAGTYAEVLSSSLAAAGIACEATPSGFSGIGGMREHAVGSQTCSWRLYVWEGGAWTHAGWDSPGEAAHFAAGFYPDGAIVPAETPEEPSAWTSVRGASAQSGVSRSSGTRAAASPPEWYRTYTSGYVDSAIVVAGRLLYHTTGGAWGAAGEDGLPHVFCLDRYTGDMVWEGTMVKNMGYEVTSPLVVGDMLIVTTTNADVYCFDRFDGTVLHRLSLSSDGPEAPETRGFPLDGEGNVVWKGRVFNTGATTPVYDSGAIYMGTCWGSILAYSVGRDAGFSKLWEYTPPATVGPEGEYTGTRGCFYFHPPTVIPFGDGRMVLAGSYEGYLHAVDASTGEEIWVNRMIDLSEGDANLPQKGTPGSVCTVNLMSGGRLLVTCSDGGMTSSDGYMLCVDASTGRGGGGDDFHWKVDALCSHPVVSGDAAYTYVTPARNGARQFACADGTETAVRGAVYSFDQEGRVVWVSADYQWIKAPLTLADGVLYGCDYSAGTFYPNGGGVTAIDAADGSEIWRIKLTPFSDQSYSMVEPTVVDGRIYVGNDYGAVYCISEVRGQAPGDGGEITLGGPGLAHWSWLLLFAGMAVALALFARIY